MDFLILLVCIIKFDLLGAMKLYDPICFSLQFLKMGEMWLSEEAFSMCFEEYIVVMKKLLTMFGCYVKEQFGKCAMNLWDSCTGFALCVVCRLQGG